MALHVASLRCCDLAPCRCSVSIAVEFSLWHPKRIAVACTATPVIPITEQSCLCCSELVVYTPSQPILEDMVMPLCVFIRSISDDMPISSLLLAMAVRRRLLILDSKGQGSRLQGHPVQSESAFWCFLVGLTAKWLRRLQYHVTNGLSFRIDLW